MAPTPSVYAEHAGNNYVELYSTTASVSLESEFAPFVRPNVYCDFNEESSGA